MSSSQAASRPQSPNVPPTDERNDEVAGDESAPLLQSEETSTAVARSTKIIRVLTPLALSCSGLTLIFLIVTAILMAAVRNGDELSYETKTAMSAVVAPALFSVLICSINSARIRRNRPLAPLAFNILLDFFIAVFTIAYAANGLANIDNGYWYTPPLVVQIFVGIALGLAVLFGVIHLVLFVMRCRIAYLMDSWSNDWPFPSGQLTFEVSIKFFKEPQKPRQSGEEAV